MRKKKNGLPFNAAVVLTVLWIHSPAHAKCIFNVPDNWNKSQTRWDGTCVNGYAEGLGILKEYDNKKVKRFFFGRFKNGNLDLGVIDQNDAYLAGQFDLGQVMPTDNRQVFINAFVEGEKAAAEAAARFAKNGNKVSSVFYEKKAKALREQMD